MNNLKEEQRRICVSELPNEIPDFSSTYEPKDSLIKKWIMNWILSAISNNLFVISLSLSGLIRIKI